MNCYIVLHEPVDQHFLLYQGSEVVGVPAMLVMIKGRRPITYQLNSLLLLLFRQGSLQMMMTLLSSCKFNCYCINRASGLPIRGGRTPARKYSRLKANLEFKVNLVRYSIPANVALQIGILLVTLWVELQFFVLGLDQVQDDVGA